MFFAQEALGSTTVSSGGDGRHLKLLVLSLRKKSVWDVVSDTVVLYRGQKPMSAFAI